MPAARSVGEVAAGPGPGRQRETCHGVLLPCLFPDDRSRNSDAGRRTPAGTTEWIPESTNDRTHAKHVREYHDGAG
jgi:hypothetical protein